MANPQHIQWLKEGVAAWNKRRERQTFKPDFVHHDFGGRTLFETNRGRKRGQWERVPLRGIHLTDANLAHADRRPDFTPRLSRTGRKPLDLVPPTEAAFRRSSSSSCFS